MYSCFLFLFAVTIWSGIIGRFSMDFDQETDDFMFWVFLILCVFMHIIMFIYIWKSRRYEMGKLGRGRDELDWYLKSHTGRTPEEMAQTFHLKFNEKSEMKLVAMESILGIKKGKKENSIGFLSGDM